MTHFQTMSLVALNLIMGWKLAAVENVFYPILDETDDLYIESIEDKYSMGFDEALLQAGSQEHNTALASWLYEQMHAAMNEALASRSKNEISNGDIPF